MDKKPLRIAITGAAGQIAYSLVFRIAAGEMLGRDQPIILQLLDVSPALSILSGIEMELMDCAYPLLESIVITDDAEIAFSQCDIAILVGAKPRVQGMERKDLLEINAEIFRKQGKVLNQVANREVKILVVGNPANTNAWIAKQSAPNLSDGCFSAMTRLDHNRGLSLLAKKVAVNVSAIANMAVWGNHSATQYPSLLHTTVNNQPAYDLVEQSWIKQTFIPTVQQRGAQILEARGKSSAASAALAIIDHIHDWVFGCDRWVSMAIPSDGSYGIEPGLIFSFPVTLANGQYQIVSQLDLDDYSEQMLKISEKELIHERNIIKQLFS